jgi:TonB family protein
MADLQNDIERYLKGELTPAEMHALERKALSDPFLAEALEGAGGIPNDELEADLHALQASLRERIQSPREKVIPMWAWPMRMAAGLALLAVSGFVIYSLLQNNSSNDLAVNKETVAPAEKTTEETKPEQNIPSENKDIPAEQPKSLDQSAAGKSEEKIPEKVTLGIQEYTAKSPVIKPQPVEEAVITEQVEQMASMPADEQVSDEAIADKFDDKEISKALEEREPVAATSIRKREASLELKKEDAGFRYSSSQADTTVQGNAIKLEPAMNGYISGTRIIRGQVRSAEEGVGLPGVNVMVKDSNVGTVTDMQGNYELTTENTKNTDLVFSFIGMQSKEVDAHTDKVDVELEQDVSQLSEVVVMGYGAENITEKERPTIEFATPEGGRIAYKQYLEKNIKYPELALQNEIEGKVTIQFTVEPSGKLTDFKVLKGIGYGCDEEVIRLIKAGPKWTATKRDDEVVKDKVKVRLRFRLPKKKK